MSGGCEAALLQTAQQTAPKGRGAQASPSPRGDARHASPQGSLRTSLCVAQCAIVHIQQPRAVGQPGADSPVSHNAPLRPSRVSQRRVRASARSHAGPVSALRGTLRCSLLAPGQVVWRRGVKCVASPLLPTGAVFIFLPHHQCEAGNVADLIGERPSCARQLPGCSAALCAFSAAPCRGGASDGGGRRQCAVATRARHTGAACPPLPPRVWTSRYRSPSRHSSAAWAWSVLLSRQLTTHSSGAKR